MRERERKTEGKEEIMTFGLVTFVSYSATGVDSADLVGRSATGPEGDFHGEAASSDSFSDCECVMT